MEWLSDMDDTAVERESLLPSSKFFFPNSIEEERDKEKAKNAVRGSDTVVLTDADADGLGAALVVQNARDNVGFVCCGPSSSRLDIADGIEIVLENADPGVSVFIADICPDDVEKLVRIGELSELAESVFWFDHHEWDDIIETFVENHIDVLDINTGDYMDDDTPAERCGAELVYKYLDEVENVNFNDEITEAVHVTGIYDCWKKTTDENGEKQEEFVDSRAKDLSDACSALSNEEYFDALENYGADIMQDEYVKGKVEEYREKQEKLEDLAVERADIENINGISVAFVYGRGPTNSIADRLKSNRNVGLVVHIKPSGGVSLRGSKEFEKCSEIASEHGGGGHKRAAGCFIPPKSDGNRDRWDTDMIDYSDHWLNLGEKTKEIVKNTVQNAVSATTRC